MLAVSVLQAKPFSQKLGGFFSSLQAVVPHRTGLPNVLEETRHYLDAMPCKCALKAPTDQQKSLNIQRLMKIRRWPAEAGTHSAKCLVSANQTPHSNQLNL
jgi:hypothetical protein